mmetsp:Transcript_13391/g.28971  ORF Transcript_13391/g.28971 Transcript_13391/m.28971 type:complete len:207 (+) Transcript_13391:150-770(+)|eukprot:CAMPEP_0172554000 /NCGR_PEP_ID=MMETSP1067-20121228/52716_1 /TAXON_ID=265564 ORGANISM="Thalassiosira punctigera, Strain Tpunct2005C2" /NCGR_SAMPLE_ID=MMETSP1067 /ASSEMBLY_ACC=CAM_ASM_000444 /LENGTH=206 /DNA_ID=CAMNT_0013342285 /DNA_START=148 /DNA_END=768 /DNA_ORIENTATION=-
MGNDASKPSNRMAIAALSHMLKITKPQLIALRDRCISVSEKDVQSPSGYRLTRVKFLAAMTDTNVAIEPDYQVLEKLFIMWDRKGVHWIDPLEFFAGISPLASVMDVATKLKFSLEVYDFKKSGQINRDDLVTVLEAMNTTSSYFGDAVLQKTQVAAIADDLFASNKFLGNDNTIVYSDNISKIANHPLVAEFTSGAGTSRYGTAQ